MADKSLNGYELKKLWRNDGDGRFTDVSVASGAADVHDSRAWTACDFDQDGDLDLFLRNYKMSSVYLRNEGVVHNWLSVRPFGTRSNRDAIGTKIEIQAGATRQTRWITAGSGYIMQQPNEAYFGLGSAARVDMLTVTWPDGTVQKFGSVEANRHISVTEGADGITVRETKAQAILPPVDRGTDDVLAGALAGADIRDREGRKVDITKLAGVTYAKFWATWCNICRNGVKEVNAAAKAHASAGAHFIGIAVLDPQGQPLEEAIRELKPEFPVYTISREEYDRLFGADAAVPRGVLLARNRVEGTFVGRFRTYLLKSYLIEALRGR